MNGMVVHRGGRYVDWKQVEGVVVPPPTDTWEPVGHVEVLELVRTTAPQHGLEIVEERHALRNKGAQYFGLLGVKDLGHESELDGISLQIGVRNSIDKSLAAALVAGSRVFVCDNLAFSGEIALSRKHTSNVRADLGTKIHAAFEKLLLLFGTQKKDIDAFRQKTLHSAEQDLLIVKAMREGILPPSRFERLEEQLNSSEPDACGGVKEPTVWRFFNACTQVMKKDHPDVVARRTGKLFELCRGKIYQEVKG